MWCAGVWSVGRILLSVLVCLVIVPLKSVLTLVLIIFWPQILTSWPTVSFCIGVMMFGFACGYISASWVKNIRRVEVLVSGTIAIAGFFTGSNLYTDIHYSYALNFSLCGILMIRYGMEVREQWPGLFSRGVKYIITWCSKVLLRV